MDFMPVSIENHRAHRTLRLPCKTESESLRKQIAAKRARSHVVAKTDQISGHANDASTRSPTWAQLPLRA